MKMNPFHYENGRLHAENVAVEDIAAKVGTPFYLYSQQGIVNRFKAFDDAARKYLPRHLTCFAVKSNANPAILKLFARMGAGADIVSGGELLLALSAGIPADKIVFSGVGKTREELTLAVQNGIKQINVESEEEALMLDEIAAVTGKKVKIALRINPDIDAHTHHKITTGTKEGKFGIAWERARPLYRLFSQSRGLQPVGIDIHVGSQVVEIEPFVEAFERAADIVRCLRDDGIDIRTIDVGGGLGVVYKDEDTPPSPEAYMTAAGEILGGLGCEVVFEPGRFLIAQSGVLVSRVVRTKQTDSTCFLVLDAGMNDLIRPAIYDAYHGVSAVRQGECDHCYDVVGPICESSDVFGRSRVLPAMKAGDLAVVETAGAYGSSMGSNYNFRPLCAEVLVNQDAFAVIRERQTPDQMLENTRSAPWL